MKLKVLSMIAALSLLLPCFACSGGSEIPEETKPTQSSDDTTVETTNNWDAYIKDDLPELDFGGETVTILSSNIFSDEGEIHRKPDFTIEELSSDAINDSLYNRERYVEERLGVEIENPQTVDYMIIDEMRRLATSGDDVYDAYLAAVKGMSSFTFEEYFTDLYDMKYLDFDKPWWSEKFNNEAEFFDSLYMTTGSLSLTPIRYSYVIYYNKTLAKKYAESIPELGEIYSVVDRGEWTFDKFAEIGGGIYEDINGNSVRDLEDIYGVAYALDYTIDSIWSGFDISIFDKTNDGWYELNVNTDKLYIALDKLSDLLHEAVGSITSRVGTTEDTKYDFDYADREFANGTNLFLMADVVKTEFERLRNMQDDYGILPYPKYNEDQKEYYIFSHGTYTAFAIPVTNTDPDVVCAVLEAMASYAYRDTMPTYLDTVLKGQYMSDPDSRRMIDIVVDGFMVDAAWIYETLSCEYPVWYRYMLEKGERSYASQHAATVKKVETVLKVYKSQMKK